MRAPIQAIASVAALLASAYFPATANGTSMMVVEASADVSVLAATNDVVICRKIVTGECAGELFALSADLQRVLWRQPETNWTGKMTTTDKFFYYVADSVVRKRSLATGELLWETALRHIPKQLDEPPDPTWWERIQSLWSTSFTTHPLVIYSGAPNGHTCDALIAHDSQLFVFRSTYESSRYFNDWLCLDATTGNLITGKGGRYLGATDHYFLAGDYQRIHLYEYNPHGARRTRLLRRTNPSSMIGMGYQEEQHRNGRVCLFPTGAHTNDSVVVFHDATKQLVDVSIFNMLERHSYWVVLTNDKLLRYGSQKRDPPGTPTPWLELYDFQAQKLAASEPLPRENSSAYSIFHIGLTAKGWVVFQADNRLLVVQTPSLKVIGNYDLGEVPRFESECVGNHRLFMNRGDKLIYDAAGTYYAQKFSAESVPHTFQIRALDPETGQVVHTHTEPVTVRKLKHE